MLLRRNASSSRERAPEDHFTGAVWMEVVFEAPPPGRHFGVVVTFEPGARTAWHAHPLGQTLYVTSGVGRIQREDGPVREIRTGDVVLFEPGERSWHGASPTETMTHVAVTERLDGEVVTWFEAVTDEQYASPPNPDDSPV